MRLFFRAKRVKKNLRTNFWESNFANQLLRTNFCEPTLANQLLRTNCCEPTFANQILRTKFCKLTFANQLLIFWSNGKFSATNSLTKVLLKSVRLEHFFSFRQSFRKTRQLNWAPEVGRRLEQRWPYYFLCRRVPDTRSN